MNINIKYLIMRNTAIIISLLLSLSILSSCNKTKTYKDKLKVHYENLGPQNIETKDYAAALFSIDESDFATGIKKIQGEYRIFLDGNLNDANAVKYLKDFATDTFCLKINNLAKDKFNDKGSLNKELQSVLQHFNYYYPMIEIPNVIYYYVSGIDYQTPSIMIQPEGILISLDFYLGNDEKIYDLIGMPRFRSIRCQPPYIARDMAQSIYTSYIKNNYSQKDVLTEMINAGKQLYFVEALNPTLPDSIIMGYTSKQMRWVEQYEGDVWASIVGNDMLYSNGLELFRTLFGDAPFTQAFSNEAPSRLGEYIGLQIIRSYMNNNEVSLQDMIRNDDLQQIFQASQYKPK